MDSRELGLVLDECLLSVAEGLFLEPTTEANLNYLKYKESLSVELSSLLQEAVDMKWPFVPEQWQYKQSVSSQDKVNLKDLISQHLPQLLTLLKAAILVREARWAVSVVFLMDRFLYWTDDSSKLLKITKALHQNYPGTPIAPQLVLRQARVYLNLGKLQKAEIILSNLITNSGATGCWVYLSESDKALVQAVSVQVRGLVLQKLGLWQEAAELIWVSLVGFCALPQPDKKGIGTSLGVLANLLVSMSDTDFNAFKSSQDIDLSFLGDNRGRRLLCAAGAAKLAVVYSQYVPLFVLTNVVIQGTCLLLYSFSMECPSSEKHSYLFQAKEAFEIGLLTKTEGHLVTSKQELHTFVMAAYSLLVTHKWLGSPVDVQARTACREAVEKLYTYFHTDNQEKDNLSIEVVNLITRVKSLLSIKPFPNSDKGSFIPDGYRSIHERKLRFTLDGFSLVIRRFQQYHASVCESSETGCKRTSVKRVEGLHPGLCITALGTLNTEHATENHKPHTDTYRGEFNVQIPLNVSGPQPRSPEGQEVFCPTLASTDVPPSINADRIPSESVGKSNERAEVERSLLNHSLLSSRQNLATNKTGTPPSKRGSQEGSVLNRGDVQYQCDPYCLSTEVSEDGSEIGLSPVGESKDRTENCGRPVFNPSERSSPHTGGYIQRFEVLNQQMETVMSDELWPASDGLGVAATQSQSPAKLRTPSGSLSDSVGSLSSWEKLSPIHPCSPMISSSATVNTHQLLLPQSLANPELLEKSSLETKSTKSSTTSQSFVHIETTDGPISGAALETERGFVVVSHPQNLYSFGVDPEAASVPTGPDSRGCDHNRPQPAPEQCLSTEMGSSFELIEKEIKHINIDEQSCDVEQQNPSHINPSCYTCQNHGMVGSVVPGKQYLLTELDYNAFLAGLCHGCLLRRLHSNTTQFKLRKYQSAHNALQLKYSRVTELWTARETYVYIGEPIGAEGKQRTALWVQSLHQEERLGSYVAKDYLKPKEIQFHLNDVERQMTAQYYVTQFNKTLYNHKVTAQIFFIPSDVLLILKDDEIVGCVTMEPYMQGDFVKLTNNTGQVVKKLKATEYGIAFGHFTYLFSHCQEVVVDLQGWVTANGKGLTYLTDPQIHSLRTPKGVSNFAERGLRYFLEEQHGPNCNDICKLLKLAPMGKTCSTTQFP